MHLTVKEAAEQLGVSPRTVYTWIHAGELTCVRRPGFIRVPDWAIKEYEERHLCPANDANTRSSGSSSAEADEAGISSGQSREAREAKQSARVAVITEQAQSFLEAWIDARKLPPEPTIAQLLDLRRADVETRAISMKSIDQCHRQLKGRIGHLQPRDWTARRNQDYIHQRGAMTAAARELEELRSTFLHYRDIRPEFIPPKVTFPPKRPPRDRFLTREEAARLIESARSQYLRLFIQIALATGRRKGAILDLTWDRVDEARGYIDFSNPDRQVTKKRRGVTRIGPKLQAALRDARQFARTDHVIEARGKPVRCIHRGFQAAAERAGVTWATPHHLKHTAISWAAENGYTVDQIADWTDTHPNTVRRIYRKFSPDYLADLAASAEGMVFDRSKETG